MLTCLVYDRGFQGGFTHLILSCGKDKVSEVYAECDSGIEESKVGKDIIIFDYVDGVWRCSECRWEIEADNKTDGNCHCLDEEGGWMRVVDLSQIPEYEPADDASSSTECSSDQEGDSDDEDFIDDRGYMATSGLL